MNCRSWTIGILLSVGGGLAVAAQRCGRLPDGFLALPAAGELLGSLLAGAAAFAVAIPLLSLLYRLMGGKAVSPGGFAVQVERAVATLAPFLLLGLYPLSVLVLHPLGVPQAILTLVNLKFLLILSAALALPRFVGEVAGESVRIRRIAQAVLEGNLRTLALALFAAFAVFYSVMGLQEDRRNLLVGDEPHYLLVMDSIKKYGTPDLTQILASGDFGDGVRRVVSHRSGHSRPDAIYEVHSIGVPLLMVVPHTLGGYRGVIVFFCLLAALVVSQVFLLCAELTERRALSIAVASLIGLTAPMIYYFRCIYPELPATLVIVFAARLILARKRPGVALAVLMALGIAFLPWLHVKFLMFSAVLLLGIAVTGGLRSRTLLLSGTLMGLSLALMAAFFSHAYGSPLPNAQYGTSEMPISPFLLRGVPGILIDQDHGLIPHAPYFLLLAAGLPLFWTRHRKAFLLTAGIAVPFVLVAGSHWMWWGGPCAPGRFLLPVVPLTGPILLLAFTDLNRRRRTLALLLAASALLIGVASLVNPGLLTTHRHVIYDFLLQGQEGFPSFPKFFFHRTEGVPSGNYLLLLAWTALALLLARRGRGTDKSRGSIGPALVAVGFLLLPGFAAEARQMVERRQGTWETGNLSLPQMNYQLAIGPWKLRDRAMTVLPSPGPGDFPKRLDAVQRFDLSAERKEGDAAERSYITRGPYFLLYPVPHEVAFEVTTEATGDTRLGELYVSGNGGRTILARGDLPPSPGRNQTVAMAFTPEAQVQRSEFQGYLERPGTVMLRNVRVTTVVELPGREEKGGVGD